MKQHFGLFYWAPETTQPKPLPRCGEEAREITTAKEHATILAKKKDKEPKKANKSHMDGEKID